MKTIGILGGLGPESTQAYYKKLITSFSDNQQGTTTFDNPEIIIYSLNMQQVLSLINNQNWADLVSLFIKKIKGLHQAGAEFAVIASNTPHVIFNELEKRSPIPLLSIVESTCQEVLRKGYGSVGLLGTQFTMEHGFYQEKILSHGIKISVPRQEDRSFIQKKIMREIEACLFKTETQHAFLNIIQSLKQENHIQAVILGCTELPLFFADTVCDVPFIDTMNCHVQDMVNYATT